MQQQICEALGSKRVATIVDSLRIDKVTGNASIKPEDCSKEITVKGSHNHIGQFRPGKKVLIILTEPQNLQNIEPENIVEIRTESKTFPQ